MFQEQLPGWEPPGVEPPAEKKAIGFKVKEKPAAGYFNWFFTRVSKVLAELRNLVVTKTTAPVTYYVSTTGNDANDGLTAGTPLRNISAALAKVPKHIRHDVNINIANGTYNEDVDISGFFTANGSLVMTGNTTTPASVVVNSVIINRCYGRIFVEGMRGITTTKAAFEAQYAIGFVFFNVIADTASDYQGGKATVSNGRYVNSVFSNRGRAVHSEYYSNIFVVGCSGVNNQFALSAGISSFVGSDSNATLAGPNDRYQGGKIFEGADVEVTSRDLTFYVNRATGSDKNDGTTSSKALWSINAAISRIPQIVNHQVIINVAPGNYDEDVQLKGFVGKFNIIIYGAPNLAGADNYTTRGFDVNRCTNGIHIQGFKSTRSNWHGNYIQSSTDVTFDKCKVNSPTTTYDGFRFVASRGTVSESEASNRGSGIFAIAGSNVFSTTNTGTGNNYGLSSNDASKIGKYSTQPGGVGAENAYAGGEIKP